MVHYIWVTSAFFTRRMNSQFESHQYFQLMIEVLDLAEQRSFPNHQRVFTAPPMKCEGASSYNLLHSDRALIAPWGILDERWFKTTVLNHIWVLLSFPMTFIMQHVTFWMYSICNFFFWSIKLCFYLKNRYYIMYFFSLVKFIINRVLNESLDAPQRL